MRLFVGIEVDETVVAAAAALVDELRGRARRLAPGARITWIPSERIHLTVRFIGNADEAQAWAIRTALEPVLPLAPFELTIAHTGTFPRTGAPRVVWAGLTAGRHKLQRLEQDVTRRLQAVGVAPEERAYNPHVTLARVREAEGLRAGALLDGLTDRLLGTTLVEAITLFESRLSSKGPAYVPLQRTRLGSV
jgi:RNA 2',3'-cyclic 3'-phosphodiesterase